MRPIRSSGEPGQLPMKSPARPASNATCALVVVGVLGSACGGDLGGSAADVDPEAYLANLVAVVTVPGAELIELGEQDPAVALVSPGAGFIPVIPLEPGGVLSVSVAYESANASVVAAGVGFSSGGPILKVPMAEGGARGSLSLSIGFPEDLCDRLGAECRSVSCYEYAITSQGKVSAPTVVPMATACGQCTEPTCAALLPQCGAASR
jgi:hypothetical protein